jgi:hypothetical protein
MMIISAPPRSANLAEIPVPAPHPKRGMPFSILLLNLFSASARGINGMIILLVSRSVL